MINLDEITDVALGKLSKAKFLEMNNIDAIDIPGIVGNQLNEAVKCKNASKVDIGMVLGFLYDAFPDDINVTLCELLVSDWHHKHEDIAMLLKKLKSPETVDCLYKAAELQFKYLDYDDTYQFVRKCIKAISAIGNSNAIEKLKLLANSIVSEIAGYAKKELSYKGVL
ncbi:MAG: hypothetical protein BGO09_02965 [Bacteroidetes bacterium 47-18]|nr:MAG: hypothetical protein BGO09_02965 [Bacteroidetes bacterium 47-18]